MLALKIPKIMDFTLIEWKACLELFYWANFKLLIQATLNAFIRTFYVLLKYHGYILFLIAAQVFFKKLGYQKIAGMVMLLIFYIIFLCVRPSIERKTIKYLFHFLPYIVGCGAMVGFILAVCVWMPSWLISFINPSFAYYIQIIGYLFSIPGICFANFFFIDTEQDLFSHAPWAKLWWYTLPFSVVCSLAIGVIFYSTYALKFILRAYLSLWASKIVMLGMFYMFALLVICWFNTVYLKKIYQDIELYIS